MIKAKAYDMADGGKRVIIHCPGCKYGHSFKVGVPQENGSVWTWNGSEENPTFSPSMLVFADNPESRCHSFVTDGKIQFLSDCFHELKNQTVELPDV